MQYMCTEVSKTSSGLNPDKNFILIDANYLIINLASLKQIQLFSCTYYKHPSLTTRNSHIATFTTFNFFDVQKQDTLIEVCKMIIFFFVVFSVSPNLVCKLCCQIKNYENYFVYTHFLTNV